MTGTPQQIVASIFEPAIAINERMEVVALNSAAEWLLGGAVHALGRPCNDVVHAADVSGNRYCHDDCVLMKMIRNREPVHCTRLDVPGHAGPSTRQHVTSLRIPGARDGEFTLVHVFHSEDGRSAVRREDRTNAERSGPAGQASDTELPFSTLSDRELEVLQKLSKGGSTEEIAAALSITTHTVRNHVQHILEKLGVHTKTAAVARALRHGLELPD